MFKLSTIDSEGLIEAPNHTGTPERRLLLGILERALLDYVGNEEKEALEATEWLFAPDNEKNRRTPFTFGWICHQLDLDTADISEKIRKMPKRGSSKIAPWYLTKNYGSAR
ncbi:MAG TPA: hypothetical protein PKA79_04525 [Oligoflexia bacterium]|nr:hypothetical protein [Oligoflexia bacterium]